MYDQHNQKLQIQHVKENYSWREIRIAGLVKSVTGT